uniref:Hydroxysteroid dehydrogenase-like protein 2 n=1 Tax=Timema monikensis TaxID=170555 RepID=A0A7R9HIU2_9NEOP|nr:unnamed protein product [Timema monikensis]
MINTGKLAGRTIFITGASRGIGKAIALKAAQDGANIVIAAKTAEPHPKLPGTIYSAAKEAVKFSDSLSSSSSSSSSLDVPASAGHLAPILFHSCRYFQTPPSAMSLQSSPLVSMSFCAWSVHLVPGLLPFSLVLEEAGGKCLPCVVDIRNEQQVIDAVQEAVSKFGGIDILVNNASAISLTGTLQTDMKRYDLMHNINTRGTFLVYVQCRLWSKVCLPYLQQSNHAHILNLSPPLNMNPFWFKNHVAYTMAKYGMSMCVLGMAEEFKDSNIAVNALWPKTAIHTAAIEMLSGPEAGDISRKPEIIADAAYAILIKEPRTLTGKFLVDEDVLRDEGIQDLSQYAVNPANADNLMMDFFLDAPDVASSQSNIKRPGGGTKIAKMFDVIQHNLNPELVAKTNASFLFVVKGDEEGTWFVDLKSGKGSAGKGKPPSGPDATLTMNEKDLFDMFTGKLKPAGAFMTGKLKISGDLQKALKLEKLMGMLKSKL